MVFSRIGAMWRSHRRKSAELRAARRALDALFGERAELLPQARLKPKHRGRAVVLEIEVDGELEASRVLFGIVRHPKAHPMAQRGEEVLELIEYLPAEGRLAVVGARNLTRNPQR